MLRFTDYAKVPPALFGVALVLTFGLAVTPLGAAKPPAAPPLITDVTYGNLFYGAIPPNGARAPVIVFVHGLGGSYVDWIEASNCPNPLPVGNCQSTPTSPGKGSNNDMYDWAYAAGYRTVFLSMDSDNSTNSQSIQTNAAVLEKLFPQILTHMGVGKVFFVAHSKGGLDLEAALATPQWIGIASAVIELGTPNQGDALADWIFSPAGNALGQTLGLLTPGVQALEIANVQQLRTQWDPIFQRAKIPFYTISGNTYACQGGAGTCPTSFSGPILTQITTPKGGKATPCGNPANAPCNDGLVTHPETLLPTTYAMELGIIGTNHYLLRMGDSSFTYINARVLALTNEQPGFTMVSTGGFGDQHNTWAWSMAWFNNKLYVGTGRETYCVTSATSAITLGIPGLYPPSIGDCTPDYHHLPLQAEIWQYDPSTTIWTRVFQSPNSLVTIDNVGTVVPTAWDIGFRGLTVVSEPGGVTALYAGGVTSGEMFEPNTSQGYGTWPPPRILRTTDGVHWAPLPQNGTLSQASWGSIWTPGQCGSAPCFLGSLTANGNYNSPQYPNYSIRSAAQLNGVLFLQVGDFPGVGRVFSSAPGVNPALGDNCGQAVCWSWASPPTTTLPIWILESFNNFLYAGTGSPSITGTKELYGVWSTNGQGSPPYAWNPIVIDGGYAQSLVPDYAMSMQIFSDATYCPGIGCLYVGTDRPNEMVRIHPDATGQVQVDATDSWDLVIGNPRTIPPPYPNAGELITPVSGIGQYFDNGFTGHFWRMGVGSQGLYMGTWDWSSDHVVDTTFGPLWSQEYGTDVWRTPDGVHWTFVSKVGLGDGNNTGSRSFAATPYGLFMGTARSIGGAQVFMLDNGTLDFNHDGVIDSKDVNMMMVRLNTKAKLKDPMDLNEDGIINRTDIQLLMTQCTYQKCAVPAIKPAASALASPVAYSAPGPQGGAVSLTWNAVSGAVDYLVYRIACSPSETTPPPAGVIAAAAQVCSQPGAPSVCSQSPQAAQGQASNALYGFPSAPEFRGRVSATAYSESAPNTLQSLYFVVAEDSNGNLSSPSNVVGGPSMAAQ